MDKPSAIPESALTGPAGPAVAAEGFDERVWVARLQQGDPDAWQQFVTRFDELVRAAVRHMAFGYSIALQASDLDDLMADVFAAALWAIRRFRRRSRLSTWVCSIARRVARRQFQRQRRVHARYVRLNSDTPIEPNVVQPLDELLRDEANRRLLDALDLLPETWRTAIQLHYLQRLSYREISRHLHMPVNSVGPVLARGRRRLRELLDDSPSRPAAAGCGRCTKNQASGTNGYVRKPRPP